MSLPYQALTYSQIKWQIMFMLQNVLTYWYLTVHTFHIKWKLMLLLQNVLTYWSLIVNNSHIKWQIMLLLQKALTYWSLIVQIRALTDDVLMFCTPLKANTFSNKMTNNVVAAKRVNFLVFNCTVLSFHGRFKKLYLSHIKWVQNALT